MPLGCLCGRAIGWRLGWAGVADRRGGGGGVVAEVVAGGLTKPESGFEYSENVAQN